MVGQVTSQPQPLSQTPTSNPLQPLGQISSSSPHHAHNQVSSSSTLLTYNHAPSSSPLMVYSHVPSSAQSYQVSTSPPAPRTPTPELESDYSQDEYDDSDEGDSNDNNDGVDLTEIAKASAAHGPRAKAGSTSNDHQTYDVRDPTPGETRGEAIRDDAMREGQQSELEREKARAAIEAGDIALAHQVSYFDYRFTRISRLMITHYILIHFSYSIDKSQSSITNG